MQEDIENKTLSLMINTGKLTERTLATAFMKALKYSWSKVKEHQQARPQGKQSVKKLIGQNQGVDQTELADRQEAKSFDRYARKYGVDYAIRRGRAEDGGRAILCSSRLATGRRLIRPCARMPMIFLTESGKSRRCSLCLIRLLPERRRSAPSGKGLNDDRTPAPKAADSESALCVSGAFGDKAGRGVAIRRGHRFLHEVSSSPRRTFCFLLFAAAQLSGGGFAVRASVWLCAAPDCV